MTDETISFPDAPRSQLDTALADLVERAQGVMETQGRLRALLRANQAVVELMELPQVLHRIVEVAVELVDARFGALGVISPSGELEQFIHVGLTEHDVEAIGHLPVGHGLLGALIDDPRPIRLSHISDDPRSSGFPAHHPPMDTFLGVPIRVRDKVFGNLYLSNRSTGEFTADDEQLVKSLAGTAGFAIENARLYAETRRRQAWAAASAEITAAMLSADGDDPLATLLERLLVLAEADLVALTGRVSPGDEIEVTVAHGAAADTLVGRRFPAAQTMAGRVFDGGQPLLVTEGSAFRVEAPAAPDRGPVMALPLTAGGLVQAVLVITRERGRQSFDAADLEMAADFADQASVALELIKSRTAQQLVLVQEDRARIARDLHDHVIQQLFGTGLQLQSVAGSVDEPTGRKIIESVSNIDGAIAQIRTAIFALAMPRTGESVTIRHRLIDLLTEMTLLLGRAPTIEFSGPVDLIVTGSLADDVLAVAREALTNTARHAGAETSSMRLSTDGTEIVLTVEDDGHGIGESTRRSGLANLETRAQARGGGSTVDSGATGTRLTWRVPAPELSARA